MADHHLIKHQNIEGEKVDIVLDIVDVKVDVVLDIKFEKLNYILTLCVLLCKI